MAMRDGSPPVQSYKEAKEKCKRLKFEIVTTKRYTKIW